MTLDLLPPFNLLVTFGFIPAGIESQFSQELFNPHNLQIFLLFFSLLKALDWSQVSKNSHQVCVSYILVYISKGDCQFMSGNKILISTNLTKSNKSHLLLNMRLYHFCQFHFIFQRSCKPFSLYAQNSLRFYQNHKRNFNINNQKLKVNQKQYLWSIKCKANTLNTQILQQILLLKSKEQMIRTIRMRQIEKPTIAQQIVYNHQQELLETNSEMSFLKLSENTSKQLNVPDTDHFTALETQLNQLTERSKLKIKCVKSNIRCLESERDYFLPKRSNSELPYHQILTENKQNVRMTQCKNAYFGEQPQSLLDCNYFQMDQNKNYVKNMILHSWNKDSVVNKQEATSRVCYSVQNSRKLFPKEIIQEKKSVGSTKRKFSESLTRSKVETTKKSVSTTKSKSNKSFKSKVIDQNIVQDFNFKKGRIYEQILSHYSIPKLLAMEPKLKQKCII